MSALGSKLRRIEGGKVGYWCLGCDTMHVLTVEPGSASPVWEWNGSTDVPSFSPSVLVRYEHWVPPVNAENLAQWRRAPWEQRKVTEICHAFVTDGYVHFLADSTHALAGQKVPLPDLRLHS